ncbi:putative ribonuclease H-like domain-containing protein [Tanacetum coccineum]
MAPTTPPPVLAVPPPSVYEVGGPSTAVAEGPSFPQVAPGLPGSDAEIAAGVIIGEIGLRVLAVEGQMQVMASQMIQAVDRVEHVGVQVDVQQKDTQIEQLQTTVTEMSSRESTLMRCILGLEKWIAALERDPPCPCGWKLRWLVTRLKVRNGEDFSYHRCMLPLTYQLMAVKKTSFPEMECGGSIDISIPDAVKDQAGLSPPNFMEYVLYVLCALHGNYDGGFVSFRDGKGKISRKGKIKIGTLDFDNVYFCKELKYNFFSMSQICDKKNNVLFTDTKCLVLSSDFKLLDESQVLLRVLRKDNIYSVDLKSVVPTKGLTCLFAKATIDESNLWHRRLGHINFKNMNKLVRGNLVRGLPSKIFENDHSCVACQKGKQHKASCKTKLVNSISKPLHMLHMDLFGPTNVKSLMKKSYCLVVTDDFSRFSWVFFLATKDETSGILKTFITEIENQLDYKVKVIRSDNGTEFKNSNGVAERRNRTLIEAARTMLVDSPTTFWVEAVNTACYVLNRVLVIKPHNKTPYELIRGRTPLIDFIKPFGCPFTILNTKDHLGKFDEKADEGFFVGYSIVSKAMRVFNKRTRIVEETLNIRFLENTPNVTGNGPDWLFDVDSLTISMNYVPVVARKQTNGIAGTKYNIVIGQAEKKTEPEQEYILIPICTTDPLISQDPKVSEEDAEEKPTEMDENRASDKDGKDDQATRSEFESLLQQEKLTVHPNSTNSINTVSIPVSAAGPSFTNDDPSSPVNADEASNAFEEHLFKRFSPFKNAFTLPPVSNVTPIDEYWSFYSHDD